MKKHSAVYMILASASVSAVIVITAGTMTVKEKKSYHAQEMLATEPTEESIPIVGYYLKAYDGGLAVFRGESDTPYRKLDASLALMTDYDREELEKGIYAEDEITINRLIEDYTS